VRELKWGSPLQGACLSSSKVAGLKMLHDAIVGTARVCILALEYATLSATRFSIGFRFILFLFSGSNSVVPYKTTSIYEYSEGV
jgi:hypothetical protein